MRIDAHLHLWSADGSDWAAGAVPPTALAVAATTADFVVSARAAGMDGAVVVHHNFPWTKPDSTFGFDHAYVLAALRAHPSFLRGMAVVDPRQGAAAGCAALEALREAGFGAVRLNEALFAELEGGIGGPVAQALYRKAGELGMPVSVFLFGGVDAAAVARLRALLACSTQAEMIVDHFGFPRQAGAWRPEVLDAVCTLADNPRVHVKISAFMRLSAGPFPAADLAPALRALAAAFGAQRLLWGSDFPYALLGAPMPPGAAAPPSGADGLVSYKAVASALEGQWKHGLSSEELGWLLGGTAQRLFWRGNGS